MKFERSKSPNASMHSNGISNDGQPTVLTTTEVLDNGEMPAIIEIDESDNMDELMAERDSR